MTRQTGTNRRSHDHRRPDSPSTGLRSGRGRGGVDSDFGWRAMRLAGVVAVLSCSAVALSGLVAASAQASAGPIEVVTEPAEATATGFVLKGKLNPNGAPTTYYFEYGQPGWGECVPSACRKKTEVAGPLTGDTQQEASAVVEVTGLEEGPYWYRLVASNAFGTEGGGFGNFTVAASTGGGSAPSEVVTEPAEAIPAGAALEGRLNPGGLPTTYYFEYGQPGRGECVDCVTKTAVAGPLTGYTQQQVPPVEVAGLEAGPYWYQLVASNADGTVEGGFVNFTVAEPVLTAPLEGGGGLGGRGGEEPKSEPPTPLVKPLTTTPPLDTTNPKPSTGARKLARALSACRRRPRRQRAICDRQARGKYGRAARHGG